jgi:uncharacterized membrane protein
MTTGVTHVLGAVIALGLGAVVLSSPKGTRRHVLLGRCYALVMGVMLVAALVTYDIDGGFGPFHFMAVVSAVTLAGGLAPYWLGRRSRAYVRSHAYFMAWSYVGLVAAGLSQLSTQVFDGAGYVPTALTSSLTILVGALLIYRRLPGLLTGQRARPQLGG